MVGKQPRWFIWKVKTTGQLLLLSFDSTQFFLSFIARRTASSKKMSTIAPATPRHKAGPTKHHQIQPIKLHSKPRRYSLKKLLISSVLLGVFSFVWAGLENIKVSLPYPPLDPLLRKLNEPLSFSSSTVSMVHLWSTGITFSSERGTFPPWKRHHLGLVAHCDFSPNLSPSFHHQLSLLFDSSPLWSYYTSNHSRQLHA